ncbi:hypothetical protein NEUTE1DRAFT_114584 [Neurospora tetrasperma FGSC 2508]|uniref:Uncharacterized protein n=1 Tax=Neurospora tetrasperma (strain FGSC 2508 / ATCC MYA-4615 / P0657) TaxID=510951 RepID=F8N402_NEUT8|nr:uncharacterized protein NEUTE1DRAFT_114584 [Neurospora tetrasperma FGSC 2508]EGO52649.1 hypothetical protein NEUTE1DRAFT_114584 [Neurospora tetrasperma FGSC 2508]
MFNFSMGADEALLTLGKEPRGANGTRSQETTARIRRSIATCPPVSCCDANHGQPISQRQTTTKATEYHPQNLPFPQHSWVIFLDARTSFVSCEKESKKKKNEFSPSINPALSCFGLPLQGSILSANTTAYVVPACVDTPAVLKRGREVALDAASLENRNEWFGWFCTKRTAPG